MATVAITLPAPEPTRINRAGLTIAYFSSFVALGLTTGSLGPTLPALASQTNSSVSAISYLFTFRSLGYVCGSLRGGKLFDRYPANTVMGIMILMAVAALSLVPLVSQLWLLLALMFALGVAESSFDVGANTLLVRVHGKRVAPFMNAMHACFGVGALIAPLIVAQLTLSGHAATQTYFVLAVLLLPIAGFTFRQRSPHAPEGHRVDTAESKTRFTMFSLVLFLFLYVGAEVGFAGWIFTYAVATSLGSVAAAAYLTSLFWGSLTLGRILMVPLAARVKPESILAVSLAAAVLSLLLMMVGSNSLLVISLTTVGLGISVASIFPATLSFAGLHMTVSGRVTGWFIVGSSMGATLIPLAIGQLLARFGPYSIIVVPALALFFAGCVFALLRGQLYRTGERLGATR